MTPSQAQQAQQAQQPRQPRHPPDSAADLAQAYRDLSRGEQTATALEANLSNLESKLDAMLAAFEAVEQTHQPKDDGERHEAAAPPKNGPLAGNGADNDTSKKGSSS